MSRDFEIIAPTGGLPSRAAVAMGRSLSCFAFCCFVTLSSHAAELTLKDSLELQTWATRARWVADSDLETPGATTPPNQILGAKWQASLGLTLGSLTLTARPQFVMEQLTSNRPGGAHSVHNSLDAKWSELYGALQASPNLTLTAGKQNFQWGCAELFNASNPIFRADEHGQSLQRSSLSDPEAQDLLRLNIALGQSDSLVAMTGFHWQNGQQGSTAGKADKGAKTASAAASSTSSPASEQENLPVALKWEHSWNTGADYFGAVIAGHQRGEDHFFGLYGAYNVADSTLFYFDAGASRSNEGSSPQELRGENGEPQIALLPREDFTTEKTYHALAEFGGRYTFAEGTEWKLEALVNDYGYSKDEFGRANTMAQANSASLIPLYRANHLPFLWRRAALVAVRLPDLGPKRKIALTFRYLHPLEDNSASTFAFADYNLSDSATAFLSASGFQGNQWSRAGDLYRFSTTIGCRYHW